MLVTLAMGCCPEKERKKGKMKSTSIDTGALVVVMMMVVVVMIFSPECGRGCHPMGARKREEGQNVCTKETEVRSRNKQTKIRDLPSSARLLMIFAIKTKSAHGRYQQQQRRRRRRDRPRRCLYGKWGDCGAGDSGGQSRQSAESCQGCPS